LVVTHIRVARTFKVHAVNATAFLTSGRTLRTRAPKLGKPSSFGSSMPAQREVLSITVRSRRIHLSQPMSDVAQETVWISITVLIRTSLGRIILR